MMFILATVIGAGNYAQAQSDKTTERLKAYSEKITKSIAKDLDLDKETEQWFINLYQEYQDTLLTTRVPMRMDERKLKKLSDEEATQLVEEIFAKNEKKAALQRAYYDRFKEKLSAKQLLKVFLPNARNMMQAIPGMSRMMQGHPGGMGGYGGQGSMMRGFGSGDF